MMALLSTLNNIILYFYAIIIVWYLLFNYDVSFESLIYFVFLHCIFFIPVIFCILYFLYIIFFI